MHFDYVTVTHAGQLLGRQADHVSAIGRYLDNNARLSSAEMGLLLGQLHPLHEGLIGLADWTLDKYRSVLDLAAGAVKRTVTDFAEAEEDTHRALSRIMAELGITMPPYTSPTDGIPAVGAGRGTFVPSDYYFHPQSLLGSGPDAGIKLGLGMADGAARFGTDVGQIVRRAGGLADSSPGVSESVDPTTFLKTPVYEPNEIENVRWSAGPLLGGIDWVFERLFGFSLLQDVILKPLTGDWAGIGKASQAWGNVDPALVALSQNLSEMATAIPAAWEGQGSDQFTGAIALLVAAGVGLSYATGFVSTVIKWVGIAAKLAATGIATALRFLVDTALQIALEAAVPGVGWAAAAITLALEIDKAVAQVKLIYALINVIVEAINSAIDARLKMIEVRTVVWDLVETAGRRAVR